MADMPVTPQIAPDPPARPRPSVVSQLAHSFDAVAWERLEPCCPCGLLLAFAGGIDDRPRVVTCVGCKQQILAQFWRMQGC